MAQETTDTLPVLIVDDSPLARKILERSLTGAGHPVIIAENGLKAMELLEERFFHLVITDCLMPAMDGLELCRAIRKKEFHQYVFIIILTSMDTDEDLIAGLEAGADEYLSKPVRESELIARLNTIKRIMELENSLSEANEQLRLLTLTDSLTKVYNRRYIFDRLPEEIARAYRYGHPLSTIMCDIDHFKEVNDSFGHQAGDAVLEAFAELLKKVLRDKVDWVARYGGEEFLIILPQTGVENAKIVAERLRKTVAGMVIPSEKDGIKISASFGVCGFNKPPEKETTTESLIYYADTSLYQAKSGGRNMVVTGESLDCFST